VRTEPRFTPAYAAPEQLLNEPVRVYTDVYALGVILYQLLTGRLPYEVEKCTPGQTELLIIGDREPEKPSAVVKRIRGKIQWRNLDLLCLTAMKRDPQRRYQSVVELLQDIDHYLRGEPLRARPDTLLYRSRKFVRRHGHAILAATVQFDRGVTFRANARRVPRRLEGCECVHARS
jgi:serine/threonine protein kinase